MNRLELIKLIARRAGVSPENAVKVLNVAKEKYPSFTIPRRGILVMAKTADVPVAVAVAVIKSTQYTMLSLLTSSEAEVTVYSPSPLEPEEQFRRYPLLLTLSYSRSYKPRSKRVYRRSILKQRRTGTNIHSSKPFAPTPSSGMEWIRNNQQLLLKNFSNEWVAVDPDKGVIAHAPEYDDLVDQLLQLSAEQPSPTQYFVESIPEINA